LTNEIVWIAADAVLHGPHAREEMPRKTGIVKRPQAQTDRYLRVIILIFLI
jgi:hypothetical protein